MYHRVIQKGFTHTYFRFANTLITHVEIQFRANYACIIRRFEHGACIILEREHGTDEDLMSFSGNKYFLSPKYYLYIFIGVLVNLDIFLKCKHKFSKIFYIIRIIMQYYEKLVAVLSSEITSRLRFSNTRVSGEMY